MHKTRKYELAIAFVLSNQNEYCLLLTFLAKPQGAGRVFCSLRQVYYTNRGLCTNNTYLKGTVNLIRPWKMHNTTELNLIK